ncbi:MAG: hypothetical protein SFZ03_05880 [Candidatus Melainabacteria bacterium]|nr:hypothetical protein [Candidatus Melainabacteria bacterium]
MMEPQLFNAAFGPTVNPRGMNALYQAANSIPAFGVTNGFSMMPFAFPAGGNTGPAALSFNATPFPLAFSGTNSFPMPISMPGASPVFANSMLPGAAFPYANQFNAASSPAMNQPGALFANPMLAMQWMQMMVQLTLAMTMTLLSMNQWMAAPTMGMPAGMPAPMLTPTPSGASSVAPVVSADADVTTAGSEVATTDSPSEGLSTAETTTNSADVVPETATTVTPEETVEQVTDNVAERYVTESLEEDATDDALTTTETLTDSSESTNEASTDQEQNATVVSQETAEAIAAAATEVLETVSGVTETAYGAEVAATGAETQGLAGDIQQVANQLENLTGNQLHNAVNRLNDLLEDLQESAQETLTLSEEAQEAVESLQDLLASEDLECTSEELLDDEPVASGTEPEGSQIEETQPSVNTVVPQTEEPLDTSVETSVETVDTALTEETTAETTLPLTEGEVEIASGATLVGSQPDATTADDVVADTSSNNPNAGVVSGADAAVLTDTTDAVSEQQTTTQAITQTLGQMTITGLQASPVAGAPTLLVADPDGNFRIEGLYQPLVASADAGAETVNQAPVGIQELALKAGDDQVTVDINGLVRLNGESLGSLSDPANLQAASLSNGAQVAVVTSDQADFVPGSSVLSFQNDEYTVLTQVFNDRGAPEVVFLVEERNENASQNSTGDSILTLTGTLPGEDAPVPVELQAGLHHFLLQPGRDGVISF